MKLSFLTFLLIWSCGGNTEVKPVLDSNGIQYWGGSVLTGDAQLHLVWIGPWNNIKRQDKIKSMLSKLSGSDYFRILRNYKDISGAIPSGNLVILEESYFPYDLLLDDKTLSRLIQTLPVNNQIYCFLADEKAQVVFASPGMSGFHGNFGDRKVLVVQDVGAKLETAGTSSEQTFNWLISMLAHELSETITDPEPGTGWITYKGQELADLCFGVLSGPVKLQDEVIVLQSLWVNKNGGSCSFGTQQ